MGCGKTLFLGAGGYVTCSWIECPRPDAAADILLERETEHLVTWDHDNRYTIKHPLRERLDDALMDCPLVAELRDFWGPPVKPGLYRARPPQMPDGGWHWESIEHHEVTAAN
jgi:hypothetical protein